MFVVSPVLLLLMVSMQINIQEGLWESFNVCVSIMFDCTPVAENCLS